MSDLIDRQSALNELWKEPTYTDPYNVLTEARDRISKLPSAQPERMTGRWASFTEYLKHLEETTGTKYDFYRQKYHDDFVFCSRCWQMKNRYENWKYCPDCGSYNGGMISR